MSEFLQRFESVIVGHKLLPAGKKILVAVSGGVDSMVLLHALKELTAKYRWRLGVAHFNHKLRGKASDADAHLVRTAAKRLGLPFFSDAADVKAHARAGKISVETAARDLRHAFLARTAREEKISLIALAHHADDQVELFFLRLLRGAGAGLAGMKWSSPSPADKKLILVRPLLGFTKPELEAAARDAKIRYGLDASNASSDFLRNRIRNELIPLLKGRYQPGLDKTVLRTMQIAGAESQYIESIARQWLSGQGGYAFEALPVALQRKVLQLRLAENGVTADFDLIEQLRQSAEVFISISPFLTVARTSGGDLKFQSHALLEFASDELPLKVNGSAGRAAFGGTAFKWRIRPQRRFSLPQRSAGLEIFDADKVGPAVILRHWHPGDRFQPIGLPSAVKLQDLFVNAKIPAARRRGLVVATTAAGHIFWVQGLRIGEQFKLMPETKRQLHWQFD